MTVVAGRPAATAPAPRAGGDPNAYQTLLSFPVEACTGDRIREQLDVWLRRRRIEVDLTVAGFHTGPAADLMVVHRDSAGGHDFRARLTETNATGVWTTELTTHLPDRGDGWLSLQVGNDRGRVANVPRLAGYLLDVLDARDGEMTLSSRAPLIGAGTVEELLDAVCDPERHGLLMVAGTSDALPVGPFADRVRDWTRHIRGMAQAVVLDPLATTAFADLVGATHAVAPWTVRTFEPAADPAWAPDARRHKVLGTHRLARQPDPQIAGFLARVARRHAATRPIPKPVRRVFRDLTRIEDQVFLDALFTPRPVATRTVAPPPPGTRPAAPAPTPPGTPVPPPPARPGEAAITTPAPVQHPTPEVDTAGDRVAVGAAAYLETIELAKELLGVDDLGVDTLTGLADQIQRARTDADAVARITRELAARTRRIAELEDEVAFHRELYAEEEFYRVVAEDERSRAEDEARWLRQQLRAHGDYTAAHASMPAELYTVHPGSFDELLDRVGELADAGVVFTGDPEVTRALDDVDGNSKLVRATWETLLVIVDYVAARAAGDFTDGGMHRYLDETPSGYRTWSRKKHAPKETESTMNQWGHERMLPVPTAVAEAGVACMQAHFKIGRVGTVSPRLHYLDDVAGTGKVYVGYVGPHLTTSSTN